MPDVDTYGTIMDGKLGDSRNEGIRQRNRFIDKAFEVAVKWPYLSKNR